MTELGTHMTIGYIGPPGLASPLRVIRRCVCKGWLSAPEGASDAVLERTVRDHQATELHAAWRRRREGGDG